MFRNQAWSKAKTLGVALSLLVLAFLLGPVAPAWTSPLQHPYRQTMPLTPPATWTPVVQGGETNTTPEPRPTALPTRKSDGSGGSASTGGLGEATSDAEPRPIAWLELITDTPDVAPDQMVTVKALFSNLGDAELAASTIALMAPGSLETVSLEADLGQVREQDAGAFVWSIPALAPGQEVVLTLSMRTSASLWPGTVMLLAAETTSTKADVLKAELSLAAPAAILPLAGRS